VNEISLRIFLNLLATCISHPTHFSNGEYNGELQAFQFACTAVSNLPLKTNRTMVQLYCVSYVIK